ncbi:MAG: CCA tRNA nucleotidyltransferase [Candidatus Omnitrophica bacterium]|nr:CCA tRNA nucleotidyltransferase [Candidatus Omnitrophota bacterium]
MSKNNLLSRLDSEMFEAVWQIGRQADQKNLRAYVVGGVVRDLLLRKQKVFDVDVVIEGDVIDFARELAVFFKAESVLHPEFRTATLFFKDGMTIDLVGARSEKYDRPGALPHVAPGTIGEDLFRRDFTINSVAIQINRAKFGAVVDFFGGTEDLKNKVIRVMHAKSFVDDPTRIIRAIRFEQRFGFSIEEETLKLLKQAVRQDAPSTVSRPRYFSQFQLMLTEANPFNNITRLQEFKAYDFLTRVNLEKVHVLQRHLTADKKLRCTNEQRMMLYLLAMADKVPLSGLSAHLDKFQLTKEERALFNKLDTLDHIEGQLKNSKLPTSHAYSLLKPLEETLIWYLYYRTNKISIRRHIEDHLAETRDIRLLINGDDVKMLGCKAGTKVNTVLQSVLYRKLDGEINGRKQELAFAEEILGGLK